MARGQFNQPFPMPDKAELRTIISDDIAGAEQLVRWSDTIGDNLKKSGLSTNQIRALFGEVRQIEAHWKMGSAQRQKALRRLYLLKPKMAYRSRRERGKAVEDLVKVLDSALDVVLETKDPEQQNEAFGRFVEFFESILAYHKAYGGS